MRSNGFIFDEGTKMIKDQERLASFSSPGPPLQPRYQISCYVKPNNPTLLSEYQFLRAGIFVHRMGWKIPLDVAGRETDRYDYDPRTAIHCVSGISPITGRERLLAGIRVHQLLSWTDSMIMNEFRSAGMIPEQVLQDLQNQYNCLNLLELSRFCVDVKPPFSGPIARDLVYATVYAQSAKTSRFYAVALVDLFYFHVMRRAKFSFRVLYSQPKYALVIINLAETIKAVDPVCASRMLLLYRKSLEMRSNEQK